MIQAIAITNQDHTAADLRRLLSKHKDGGGCAASSGACVDIGGPVAERGSEAKWDGAPELARLGASLQRRGSSGALLTVRPWPGTAVE